MRKSRFEIPFPIMRLISWFLLKPFFAFEVRGLAHLENVEGRVILAGNHTGFLDSFAVVASFNRYFHFLMTEEVFTWGLIGKWVRYANIMPLYKGRERRAMVEAIRVLHQEGAICIFPEGKLTQDGQLNPFNEGVAFLQEKSKAPIVPFVIHGGFEAWPQTQKLPVFRKVILQFGEPIQFGFCQSRAEVIQTIEQRIMDMRETPLAPSILALMAEPACNVLPANDSWEVHAPKSAQTIGCPEK